MFTTVPHIIGQVNSRVLAFFVNVIARKKIFWSCHGFKFKVIPTTVFKEPAENKRILKLSRVHCPLLSWLAFKPQMWLNYEFHFMLLQSCGQFMKLRYRQDSTKMRNWYLISIDRVEVISASIILSHIVANNLAAIKRVVLPLITCPSAFRQF